MTKLDVEKFRVVGIAARTSHRTENSSKAKIPHLWKRFFAERILEKIPNRVNPQKVFAVYTEYDSDEYGEYTFILGTEVSEFRNIPEGMIGKTIKQDNYEMIQSEDGPFREVVPKVWKKVWKNDKLREKRKFETDFESYEIGDQNQKGTVKLFVGVAS
ncbi:GyrI-like domain-containing protein [Pseudobacteriovorax antillogorgiicola]|uniref:Predicted transcriptional regulator YdeE, contains AraC-type DNA-binding domain n=1 Tax=Pseudobacteriovorax antillogorgiicola TaxID=1513793 RepID=A0A1Y6CC28_9BACT|nr:effector binding domain-containing protein [Pseudobacteriovorax antillogorgiicola]TCS49372.1 putative transcriptional regulator YdeE [Pseudobacteriovorax antillogorgiicola]SMF47413.1 Predicted transcriptional regulator YdeE, contains AraC-type DNA-binding domain [Pseudobacteriovorax antillogorgiicola]